MTEYDRTIDRLIEARMKAEGVKRHALKLVIVALGYSARAKDARRIYQEIMRQK